MITGSRFAFALVGFIIVAALIEQYDEGHRTGYLTWYVLLILLVFTTAHRGELAVEISRINGMLTGNSSIRTTNAPTGARGR